MLCYFQTFGILYLEQTLFNHVVLWSNFQNNVSGRDTIESYCVIFKLSEYRRPICNRHYWIMLCYFQMFRISCLEQTLFNHAVFFSNFVVFRTIDICQQCLQTHLVMCPKYKSDIYTCNLPMLPWSDVTWHSWDFYYQTELTVSEIIWALNNISIHHGCTEVIEHYNMLWL